MTFDIQIDVNGGRFKMKVERVYAGESLEKFKVTGGSRSILLQSNRPLLLATRSRKTVDWKLLEGDFRTTNKEAATYALFRIMTTIEEYIKEKEPSLDKYRLNKTIVNDAID